jgi:hypothetical protein
MSRNQKNFKKGNGTACTTCGTDIDTSSVAGARTSIDKQGSEGKTTHHDSSGKPVYEQYHKWYESDNSQKPVFEAGPTCTDCSSDRESTLKDDSSRHWEQQRRDTDRDWWQ